MRTRSQKGRSPRTHAHDHLWGHVRALLPTIQLEKADRTRNRLTMPPESRAMARRVPEHSKWGVWEATPGLYAGAPCWHPRSASRTPHQNSLPLAPARWSWPTSSRLARLPERTPALLWAQGGCRVPRKRVASGMPLGVATLDGEGNVSRISFDGAVHGPRAPSGRK